jgi:hypothetical protein
MRATGLFGNGPRPDARVLKRGRVASHGRNPGDGGAQASIRRHRAEHRAGRSSRRHPGGSVPSRLAGFVAKSRQPRRARNQSIASRWSYGPTRSSRSCYRDLGPEYLARRNPAKLAARLAMSKSALPHSCTCLGSLMLWAAPTLRHQNAIGCLRTNHLMGARLARSVSIRMGLGAWAMPVPI